MKKNVASLVSLLVASGLAMASAPAFAEGTPAGGNTEGGSGVHMPAAPSGGAAAREAAQVPPDNSGRNVRDRNDDTVTPGDQSNTEVDIKTTADIRKAVVDDDSLSTNAQNVKIVTANGVVTLRGPVKNEAEKKSIEEKARKVAGVTKVDNQLEVTGE